MAQTAVEVMNDNSNDTYVKGALYAIFGNDLVKLAQAKATLARLTVFDSEVFDLNPSGLPFNDDNWKHVFDHEDWRRY
ncbi:hypothetical protein P154DRAFT_582673 [Amniculicola lignicola CBS 123094]|uniref:Uncharacterized protein n=1 Tax=Amniculicola lignicola CBS 123094 TaxID=1392246 RepID=A0A6A5VX36_9PLEO|nr:hypothetical protein P154DRAFT_582673 [Amniculicola lignicola CBS 123094]